VQPAATGLGHGAEQLLVIAIADADGGGDDAALQELAGMVGELGAVGAALSL
jgi:hypothetical protein